MSETNFKNVSGSSRDMDVQGTAYEQIVWRAGSPILDSELNASAQIINDKLKFFVESTLASGFLIDPESSKKDFISHVATNGTPSSGYENAFEIAPTILALKGKLLKISGWSATNLDIPLKVTLSPAGASPRGDLVYLEVWEKIVKSTDLTPKYGFVGNPNFNNQIQDADILGVETAHRVQLQYQIKVKANASDIKGLNPQGPLADTSNLTATYDLDSLSGIYTATINPSDCTTARLASNLIYAIPLCRVYRRSTTDFNLPVTGNSQVDFSGVGGFDGLSGNAVATKDILDLRKSILLPNGLTSYLNTTLLKLLQNKTQRKLVSDGSNGLKSGASTVIDSFNFTASNAPNMTKLDIFNSGRTVYSDSTHSQTYDLFLKFEGQTQISQVNSQGPIYWASEALVDPGVAYNTSSSEPYKLNPYSFIVLDYSRLKPKNNISDTVGRNSFKLLKLQAYGKNFSSNAPTTLALSFKNKIPNKSLTITKVGDTSEYSLDITDNQLVAGDLVVIPNVGCYPIFFSNSSWRITKPSGASWNDTISSAVDFWDGSPQITEDLTTSKVLVYNINSSSNVDLGYVKLTGMVYGSPGFGSSVNAIHRLSLLGSFPNLLAPEYTTSNAPIFNYAPKELSQWYKSNIPPAVTNGGGAGPVAPTLPPVPKTQLTQGPFYTESTSRTFVFQPYQSGFFDLSVQGYSPTFYLSSPYTSLFETTKKIDLPEICHIPEGYLDIPHVPEAVTRTDKIPFGYNYLFGDISNTLSEADNTLWIAGGSNNTGAIEPALFITSGTPSDLGTQSTNGFNNKNPVYAVHVTTPIEGLKLPDHIAPSRIYAIYDSSTAATSYSNRKTLSASNNSANLLVTGLSNKTLFRQGKNFYIPKALIKNYDKTKIYVIEGSIFAFTEDGKSVFPRKSKDSVSISSPLDLPKCSLLYYGPAPSLDSSTQAYIAYNSTPYQGGFSKSSPSVPPTPLALPTSSSIKYYQVLDTLDFAITLGTGHIAGKTPPPEILSLGKETLNSNGVQGLVPLDFNAYLTPHFNGSLTSLPLGALAQDYFFKGEKILTEAIQFKSGFSTMVGPELDFYDSNNILSSRVTVDKGTIIGLVEDNTYPSRRGFGSAFAVLGDSLPVPLEWYSGVTDKNINVLACKAMLVRDVHNNIKLVVCTYAHLLGTVPQTATPMGQTYPLFGVISPKGHGVGYNAVDIFELDGNPVYSGRPFKAPVVDLNLLPNPVSP